MGRKAKSDQPLEPLRVRVHPDTIARYQRVANAKDVPAADLQRAVLDVSEQDLEQIAESLTQSSRRKPTK